MTRIDANETIKAAAETSVHDAVMIFGARGESFTIPSFAQAYCVVKIATAPSATRSKALAVPANVTRGERAADKDVASRMSRMQSAAVVDHVTAPKSER